MVIGVPFGVGLEASDRRARQNSSVEGDEFYPRDRSLLQMTLRGTSSIVFRIEGPITRADLRGLCDRVCGLLEQSDAGIAYCRVEGIEPDAVTVDALVRLQLAARRHGCQVRLRDASPELLELVAFMGLSDVLPDEPD
jgi:ABC-type transporter Mla MlaB component